MSKSFAGFLINLVESSEYEMREIINLLAEYEPIPWFGRCDCATNAHGIVYGNMLGKAIERSDYLQERLDELKYTAFYIENSDESRE